MKSSVMLVNGDADEIKELIVFSVSPEYMAIRTALGIAQQ